MDENTQALLRAKRQAYRLLAYRSQTSSELRDRLQRRGYAAPIVAEVIRQLESDGYIDDRKVAVDWARYRLQSKPLGRRRLAWELQRRGISVELSEEVLRQVYGEFDEVMLAEEAARKRLRSQKLPRSARERQRFVRYLMSLGFEGDVVAAALASVDSPGDDGEIIAT